MLWKRNKFLGYASSQTQIKEGCNKCWLVCETEDPTLCTYGLSVFGKRRGPLYAALCCLIISQVNIVWLSEVFLIEV